MLVELMDGRMLPPEICKTPACSRRDLEVLKEGYREKKANFFSLQRELQKVLFHFLTLII